MRADAAQAAFRSLPMAALDAIVPGTALILAPHADDESLGCGGLIAASCAAGRPPLVVIVTDGVGSHPGSPSWPADRLRRTREAEAQAAVALLGLPAGRLSFLRLPDTRSPRDGPEFERAVATLSALADAQRCDTVLSTWRHDPHCDHDSAWMMGRALARRNRLALLAYPVWGWLLAADALLDGGPPVGWRLDITPHLPDKQAAIRAHRTQYGDLITDDPDGFRLPDALLAVFAAPYEVFLQP